MALSHIKDLGDPSDFWPCSDSIGHLGYTLFFAVAFLSWEGNPVIEVSFFHSLNWMIKPLCKYIYICTWMPLFFLLYRKLTTGA